MSENSKDCWQCRLTSGGGLLVAGAYVVYQSKKLKPNSNNIVSAIGYGLGILGLLRGFSLPPFRSESQKEDKQGVGNAEENEYIIGKFPSKFN